MVKCDVIPFPLQNPGYASESVVSNIAINAVGLGFKSQAVKIRHSVANGSPPLRRFFRVVLPEIFLFVSTINVKQMVMSRWKRLVNTQRKNQNHGDVNINSFNMTYAAHRYLDHKK